MMPFIRAVTLALAMWHSCSIQASGLTFRQEWTSKCHFNSRRGVLTTIPAAFMAVLLASNDRCVANSLSPPRDVDVGNGFDLFSERQLLGDVIYPSSMEGIWVCERVVAKVEGDSFQAETAFQSLGGTTKLEPGMREKFQESFILSPMIGSTAVVADRRFEMSSRKGSSNIQWNVANPNVLIHNKTTLRVVKRSVEVPNEQGFGFDELIRVDEPLVTRAVQIKRRYRRAFDEKGNRVVEGLEIMKTFRVLDGVAGTDPTSTTKSTIRMVRPS
ncbi:hypothetical protein IV203_005905 [Nitzschia inconspicua]|uniref:DUF6816 domain-containing protein n=1 Tax=Nitzschia inconspicua TaxID=303405 RepID=A0A9K3KNX8_9STRA|nr:hypothetical protein IV203_005905 [Nitzschia inconspicua]